jgi:hypothetical protein
MWRFDKALPETKTSTSVYSLLNNRPERTLLLITQEKLEFNFQSASVLQSNQQTVTTLQPLTKFGIVHFLSLNEGEIIR